MQERLTKTITSECDRIAAECDRLIDNVASTDVSIERLHLSERDVQTQIVRLDEAQSAVKKRRKALATRVFWSAHNPIALMNRLGESISTLWLRSGRRGRTYRSLKPATDAGE